MKWVLTTLYSLLYSPPLFMCMCALHVKLLTFSFLHWAPSHNLWTPMWTTDEFFLSQWQNCCCNVPSLNYLNWLRISVCKRKFLRMSGNRGFILLVKEFLFWPFLTCENLPSVTVKEKKESQFVAELNTNVFTQTLEGCNYRVNLTFSISRVSITNYRQ